METDKVEKAGVNFGASRSSGRVVIEFRLHHDTIAALKGAQVGFELLNGISLEQAKRIADALNENVIGLLVTLKSENKTSAASS